MSSPIRLCNGTGKAMPCSFAADMQRRHGPHWGRDSVSMAGAGPEVAYPMPSFARLFVTKAPNCCLGVWLGKFPHVPCLSQVLNLVVQPFCHIHLFHIPALFLCVWPPASCFLWCTAKYREGAVLFK